MPSFSWLGDFRAIYFYIPKTKDLKITKINQVFSLSENLAKGILCLRECVCVFIAYYEYELPKEGDMIFLYLLLSILQTSGD